jgi:hypothetical protein
MEHARSMILHVGMPLQFWEDDVDIVIYLINRGHSISLDGRISEDPWTCKNINYSFLKTFDCECNTPRTSLGCNYECNMFCRLVSQVFIS